MSDNWIAVIPYEPDYIPSTSQAEAALSFLQALAPDSDEVTFSTDDHIRFRDCGANLESISCPFCGAHLDQDWWSERMAEDSGGDLEDFYDRGFLLKPITLPCCGASASLNQLVYSFDQGFSRFILEAMNPNIGRLDDAHVQRLSDLLGTPLRVIYQHI
jgi:hypothetical protein